jgi:hypothetical protein
VGLVAAWVLCIDSRFWMQSLKYRLALDLPFFFPDGRIFFVGEAGSRVYDVTFPQQFWWSGSACVLSIFPLRGGPWAFQIHWAHGICMCKGFSLRAWCVGVIPAILTFFSIS